jgi:hypothetical protein
MPISQHAHLVKVMNNSNNKPFVIVQLVFGFIINTSLRSFRNYFKTQLYLKCNYSGCLIINCEYHTFFYKAKY